MVTGRQGGQAPRQPPRLEQQALARPRRRRVQNLRIQAVLFTWAPGAKPTPGLRTYRLLGEAAARVHHVAEGFTSSSSREMYDEAVLIDEQLQRMKPLLIKAGTWESTVALGERLRDRLSDPALERGGLPPGLRYRQRAPDRLAQLGSYPSSAVIGPKPEAHAERIRPRRTSRSRGRNRQPNALSL